MRFSFDELPSVDLIANAVYEQGTRGTIADEPISKLVYVGNQGGFRARGGWDVPGATLVVLFTTGSVGAWPDRHDRATGRLTYFGDNRAPGPSIDGALEDHPGNRLLRMTFAALASGSRSVIPPFLVFRNVRSGARDVEFVGLAAPGAPGLPAEDALVAVWSTTADGQPFINYRASFTVLDVECVERSWLDQIRDNGNWLIHCPPAWRRFVDHGEYVTALR